MATDQQRLSITRRLVSGAAISGAGALLVVACSAPPQSPTPQSAAPTTKAPAPTTGPSTSTTSTSSSTTIAPTSTLPPGDPSGWEAPPGDGPPWWPSAQGVPTDFEIGDYWIEVDGVRFDASDQTVDIGDNPTIVHVYDGQRGTFGDPEDEIVSLIMSNSTVSSMTWDDETSTWRFVQMGNTTGSAVRVASHAADCPPDTVNTWSCARRANSNWIRLTTVVE